MTQRAIVLSGGGPAGAAWMLGLLRGLRDDGVDLAEADLVVGTSAGARTGAVLLNGVLDEAVEIVRGPDAPQLELPATMGDLVEAWTRILAEVSDEQEAARRIANLEPLGTRLAPIADRRRVIADGLPAHAWPDRRLAITAVDAESGRRVVFEADSGVPLVEAATASAALPGILELAEIDGRRYADGGVHSLYSADLAVGHHVVVVISPLPMDDYLRSRLDAEIAALGEAMVHVILADEASLSAIGPDPLSAHTARAALDSGEAQARSESTALRSVWSAAGD